MQKGVVFMCVSENRAMSARCVCLEYAELFVARRCAMPRILLTLLVCIEKYKQQKNCCGRAIFDLHIHGQAGVLVLIVRITKSGNISEEIVFEYKHYILLICPLTRRLQAGNGVIPESVGETNSIITISLQNINPQAQKHTVNRTDKGLK